MRKIIEWMGERYEQIVLIIMLGCLIFLFASCGSTTKAVSTVSTEQIERTDFTAKVDSIFNSLFTHDSIYVHDSVFVKVGTDTTYVYKEREVARWHVRTDTVVRVRTDTVVVTDSRSVKETEKRLKSVSFGGGLGGMGKLVLIGVVVAMAVVGFYRIRRKS